MRIGLALTLCSVLTLGACGSSRLGGPIASAAPVYNAPPPMEPVVAAPAGVVSAEPLPPPGVPGAGPVVADVPGYPPPAAAPAAPAPAQPQQIASVAPSRSSVVGGWTAREASGSCRVQLSSAPALDLYKASATGCSNRDLGRVTAWDFRDGEVYLYQPGGAVAARLRPSGGAMEGVLAKSGAPLSLTR